MSRRASVDILDDSLAEGGNRAGSSSVMERFSSTPASASGSCEHLCVVANWDEGEVDKVVDVYFSMLELELAGQAYSKASFREQVMTDVRRSKGSIEYKLQNISAVLAEIGAVFIDGYKPASNYQQLLRSRVIRRFEDATTLRRTMLHAVESPVTAPTLELGDPSAVPEVALRGQNATLPRRGVRGIDFQAIESRNRTLGLAGEKAVVRREQRVLVEARRDDLARRVRHASIEDGDGLGYDVLSFRPDGTERFLEVKTTRYAPQQPFLVTRNEVELSIEEPARFTLVRVYRFEAPRAGFYELSGSLRSTASLSPTQFSATPRAVAKQQPLEETSQGA